MIFPQIDFEPTTDNPIESKGDLKLLKQYAWDFDNNEFILNDGKFKVIEGIEAVKIWIWKALHTQRYRYMAYNWDYGNEIEDLVGKGYSDGLINSEVERYLKEALLINPYIKNISNINTNISNDFISVTFTVNTVYGEVIMNV